MIGVIADDLTGAAELGAVGLRHGLNAEVSNLSNASSRTDLVCIDTDSRSCPPEEAGRRVALAASTLRASGAKWIYKKVDSVLRGHVAKELEAAMKTLGLSRALLLPANPKLERVIRNGHYFVGEKPINETDFRFDPEYPRRNSYVCDLLGASVKLPVQVCKGNEPLHSEGIIIGDVETAVDLRNWARRWSAPTLAAGAAEFFAALLEATGRGPLLSSAVFSAILSAHPELFVCGSASESTRAFVAESRQRNVPVIGLPEELVDGVEFTVQKQERISEQVMEALKSSSRVVLQIGLPPVNDPYVSRRFIDHLTRLAELVLSRVEIGHVYAEGGATASGLARHMDWTRQNVLGEIAPGVVTLRNVGDRKPLLTLKPGSYAWPSEVRK